jgi:hypothetical protein
VITSWFREGSALALGGKVANGVDPEVFAGLESGLLSASARYGDLGRRQHEPTWRRAPRVAGP